MQEQVFNAMRVKKEDWAVGQLMKRKTRQDYYKLYCEKQRVFSVHHYCQPGNY
jgi:hypothetical protein